MSSSKLTLTAGTVPSTPASGKVSVYANSSKNLAFVDDTGRALDVVAGPAVYQATPNDPVGTTNTSGLMMGLAGAITPAYSGRILIIISGNLTNSTAAAGDGAKAQIRYGTGSAPANAAALTGTPVGTVISSVLERATASDLQAFTCQAVVTGLTLATVYWVDISLAAIVGGTGQAKNISISIVEI